MVDEYSIRPYRSGDEEEIVQILQLAFKGWPSFDLDCSPQDHWRWKYLHSPAGQSMIYVGESGGDIVGCTHIYTINLKMGGQVVKCGLGADAAVHPDHRGKGLWKPLVETRKARESNSWIAFRMGITSSESIVRHYKRAKRDLIPYGLISFMRIGDLDLHLRMMKTQKAWMKKHGYRLMRGLGSLTALSKAPQSAVKISTVKSFDDRFRAFWSEVSGRYDLIVERSPEYLNWRFCDERAGRFTVRLAGGDEVLGYSVLRTNRRDEEYPNGVIEELMALPDRPDVVDALLRDALSHFGEDVNVVRCRMLSGHPYVRFLKRHGFVDVRDRPYFSYEKFKETEFFNVEEIPVNRMYFANGDFDWG